MASIHRRQVWEVALYNSLVMEKDLPYPYGSQGTYIIVYVEASEKNLERAIDKLMRSRWMKRMNKMDDEDSNGEAPGFKWDGKKTPMDFDIQDKIAYLSWDKMVHRSGIADTFFSLAGGIW